MIELIGENRTNITESNEQDLNLAAVQDNSSNSNANVQKIHALDSTDVSTPSDAPEATPQFFDLNLFINEIHQNSDLKNREYAKYQRNMSAYDVSSSCMCNIIHKLRNTPIKSYAVRWLPVILRSYLGNSVHNFIQENSKQFTENEVSLKIPSIRFSGRLDNLINDNILVEIKSLPYNDYRKIIKNKEPRLNDFNQTLAYKYILENHLEEAKAQPRETLRSDPPKLNKYNIRYIQYIYVAHDLLSSDVDSLKEANELNKHLRQTLNSKKNPFYFITNLAIDLEQFDISDSMNYIKNKIERVNHYMDTNTDPTSEDEFVDTKACFFCAYPSICTMKGGG